jgi:hypothetical protein
MIKTKLLLSLFSFFFLFGTSLKASNQPDEEETQRFGIHRIARNRVTTLSLYDYTHSAPKDCKEVVMLQKFDSFFHIRDQIFFIKYKPLIISYKGEDSCLKQVTLLSKKQFEQFGDIIRTFFYKDTLFAHTNKSTLLAFSADERFLKTSVYTLPFENEILRGINHNKLYITHKDMLLTYSLHTGKIETLASNLNLSDNKNICLSENSLYSVEMLPKERSFQITKTDLFSQKVINSYKTTPILSNYCNNIWNYDLENGCFMCHEILYLNLPSPFVGTLKIIDFKNPSHENLNENMFTKPTLFMLSNNTYDEGENSSVYHQKQRLLEKQKKSQFTDILFEF